MSVKQISIFVQNEKGALSSVLKTIGDESIEIRALSIADTIDFGILRIITDDEQKTEEVLKNAGYVCNVTEVVAACVEDKFGGLAKELELLNQNDIEIEYLYAFGTKSREKACVVLRVNDTAKTEKLLVENGIEILGEEEIKNL